MAKIRVLRLIEYTYESVERMEDDMGRWTTNINSGWWGAPNNSGMRMKSVALPLEVLEDDHDSFDTLTEEPF